MSLTPLSVKGLPALQDLFYILFTTQSRHANGTGCPVMSSGMGPYLSPNLPYQGWPVWNCLWQACDKSTVSLQQVHGGFLMGT